jgi:hypothetical protein
MGGARPESQACAYDSDGDFCDDFDDCTRTDRCTGGYCSGIFCASCCGWIP